MSVCFYCLSKEPSIQICVGCRTRVEFDAKEAAHHKRNSANLRGALFRVEKENMRLREALAKKGKKK